MKRIILLFIFFTTAITFGQQQTVDYEIDPCTFSEMNSVTLKFDGNTIDESSWGITNNELYLWAWSFDLNNENIQDCPSNGTWTNSNNSNLLSYNSSLDEYSISFVPTEFYLREDIGRIGFLVKAKDGTGDKKTQDMLAEVGISNFQVNRTSPILDNSLINPGDTVIISSENTCGNADYTLRANGSIVSTQSNTSNFSFSDTNINENRNYELSVTIGADTKIQKFTALLSHNTVAEIMPEDYVDGINYDSNDPTKATLVLYATNKNFVYVAGSFNDWQPTSEHAMKRDFTRNNKFWITLTGLTPGEIETYQYWVVDETPMANSPSLVKTADPYSTLILSSFDDSFIPSNSYPNLPNFPSNQEFEVSVLQTNKPDYNWQVANFNKPKKEDLIIYEVLVRDFDANRNYQDLIDKIDYFKDLNINAIQFMPIMEFEGNESWGYNTSYHMALDKFYGTEEKFKELIDLCHQNGIAVILDIALNHAFGRNPMVRMWMDDSDGNGFGNPTSENPYFNTSPRHSYNVGSDFDHSNAFTQNYVKRVVKHWIEEFRIDGFRWDLTKGFTQNCTENDEGCTNQYQQDRIDILKEYADYSWSLDPDHYIIFEHLGSENEEKEWANYRYDEGKGIMMWGKMTDPYNELTMGQNGNKNIDGIGHKSRSTFLGPRIVGYPESYDEERLMYKNIAFGNSSNSSHDVTDINTALSRMSALGAISVMVPGPKMIWHFGDLGMENSIFTCNNGSVNTNYDAINGDCKLDTKPQPQWTNNWISDALRKTIYDDWSRLHALKSQEAVFEGDYSISSGDYSPRIRVFDDTLPTTELRDVFILANFDVVEQSITTNFTTGVTSTWYDLMDPTGGTSISQSTTSITIPAGQFRIFGNQSVSTLTDSEFEIFNFSIYPNPVESSFKINTTANSLKIYDLTGKLVKEYNGNFNRFSSFDISDLKTGVFIIQITDMQGLLKTVKLIKQ